VLAARAGGLVVFGIHGRVRLPGRSLPHRVNSDVPSGAGQPVLAQGDFAVFEYHRTPRKQGQIVLAFLPETYEGEPGVQTIKRIYQEGNHWVLRAENPSYSDIRFKTLDTKYPILGIYIEKL
jgi:hypothetical protein